MTHHEAIQNIKEYTGSDDLLASLERIQSRINEPDVIMSRTVRVSYYTLMAGFTEMFG